MLQILNYLQGESESPVTRSTSFKWASLVKSAGKSPTKASTVETIVETPQSSPQRAEHDIHSSSSRYGPQSASSEKSRSQSSHAVGGTSTNGASTPASSSATLVQPQLRPSRQDSSDNLKSFKVSLDDPAWKVLPAALKKYKINNDDWQNYAMFICYGSPGALPCVPICVRSPLTFDRKPYRALSQLRREATLALPEAQGCQEESGFHAQAH